ncbi:hypothetical protein KCU88_g376, partial [Aureobasidium melanogenum]
MLKIPNRNILVDALQSSFFSLRVGLSRTILYCTVPPPCLYVCPRAWRQSTQSHPGMLMEYELLAQRSLMN